MGNKLAEQNALPFLVIATAITIIVNIAFLLLPQYYYDLIYGTLQILWPIIAILALIWIYDSTDEKNIRFFTFFCGIALVPWTISLLMWKLILPMFLDNDLAYYIAGFGYLIGYGIIILGLLKLRYSRQWYIDPEIDRLMNIIAGLIAAGVAAFVLANVDLASPRLSDVMILLAYIVADIIIMLYCSKLFSISTSDRLRYLVMAIWAFVFINSLGDMTYTLRWLFSLKSILSIPMGRFTDIIYNFALIFLISALLLYNTRFRQRAIDSLNNTLYDARSPMENVVMQSLAAMCICDMNGNITLINDALLTLFNARRPDFPGNYSLFEHMRIISGETAIAVDTLMAGEAVVFNDMHLARPINGQDVHLSVKIFPIRGGDGKISNYVFILDNITERLAMEEELRESKKQAELYVDLMGHDINNMNQIAMGFLEIAEDILMTEGKLTAEHLNLLRKPIESLNNSSRLVDNVKKLQKEKSGQLNERVMDVGEVLREVIKQYERVPGRSVSIVCEDSSGSKVMANDLLKEVFSNLVGNAIKHSKGPLSINIRSSLVDEGGKKLCRIVIEDNGPGIPDAIKARIFDRSQKGDGMSIRKGLGLYLVNTLVNDYFGTIRVEDRVQGDQTQGSRFVVTLPAE